MIKGALTAATTLTFSYSGSPVAIPDGADLIGNSPGAPAYASLVVSGFDAGDTITKVVFRFDGTISTSVGNTAVGLDHSFINDLDISLISPAGTSLLMIDNTDGSGNNFAQTILDDAATTNIQTAVSSQNPFNGTWAPANPLSRFNGELPNGTWQLKSQDFFSIDTGSIRAFSIIITAEQALAAAHWLGQTDNTWAGANWASDADGTPITATPGSGTDVFFSATGANNRNTVLGADLTIKSLTVQGDIVSIDSSGGSKTLTVTGNTIVDNSALYINAGVTVAGSQNLIASAAGTSGSVTVSGTDAKWTATGDLNVGFEGGGTLLRVENGGLVSAGYTKVGGYVTSTENEVVVTGAGSQLINTNDLIVGYGGNGNTLTIENGATATNVNGFLGFRFDATSSSNNNSVTVTGTDSLWTNTGTLYLGDYGMGNSLSVSAGGKVTVNGASQDAVVGNTAGATGNSLTVTGAGSEFANDATFYLGKAGGGNTLTVQEGGTMTTKNVRLGGDGTSSGNTATVTGTDSVWNISGTALRVGSNGSTNALNITAGGVVNVTSGNTFVGYGATSAGNSITISGTGSTLYAEALFVGRLGTDNTVTVAEGGYLSASSITLAEQAGSSGTLKIGSGGLAGSVDTGVVTGGAGTAVLEFDHTDDLMFLAGITGSVTVNKNGTGITYLGGLNNYTGATNVNAGVLAVAGVSIDVGDVTVAKGAILAGEGGIITAEDRSMFINGGINVESLGVKSRRMPIGTVLTLGTGGTGSIVMGAGSFIGVDLFTGAGLGDNVMVPFSSDVLQVIGRLDVTAGTTLVVGNPAGMTGFAVGDQWQLLTYCGCEPVQGTLLLDASSLGLQRGLAGSLDTATGVFSIIDVSPQLSTETGLQTANVQDQSLMAGIQGLLGDINGRLFNLRSGGGEEDSSSGSIASSIDDGVVMGQGDGPEGPVAKKVLRSRQWEVYATVGYANISLGSIGTQAGADSQTWAPGVGIERHLTPHWTIGFAASLLETHQTYGNNLGTLEIEGVAFSTYASYVRGAFWGDLLYSLGRYDLRSDRNPGFAFPMAQGETVAWSNAIQLNTGWNFRFMNNTLTTGPFLGVDYLHISVDSYAEAGGGAAALAYGKREVDSLISRLGWSVSKRFETDFATITPQFRVSYERQNISNNNGTSVNLINQPFSASTSGEAPGQDYMVAGAGVTFQFTPDFSMLLSYQGQFFRQDMQAHFGAVRFTYKF